MNYNRCHLVFPSLFIALCMKPAKGQISMNISRDSLKPTYEGDSFSYVCTVYGGTCPGLITLNHGDPTETQVTNGCDVTDSSYCGNTTCDTCTGIPSNCIVHFGKSNKTLHDGIWRCRCSTYVSPTDNMTIYVDGRNITTVGQDVEFTQGDPGIIWCHACFYPNASVEWSAKASTILQSQIGISYGVCKDRDDLVSLNSTLVVTESDMYTCKVIEPSSLWAYEADINVSINGIGIGTTSEVIQLISSTQQPITPPKELYAWHIILISIAGIAVAVGLPTCICLGLRRRKKKDAGTDPTNLSEDGKGAGAIYLNNEQITSQACQQNNAGDEKKSPLTSHDAERKTDLEVNLDETNQVGQQKEKDVDRSKPRYNTNGQPTEEEANKRNIPHTVQQNKPEDVQRNSENSNSTDSNPNGNRTEQCENGQRL